MNQQEINKIRRKLKKHLDRPRYEHTLGVMYTAGSMAMCHNVDIDRAMTAGILHDCAKCIPDDKKIRLCSKYHLNISDAEYANPSLIHAKLGAFMAAHKYHIDDKEVVEAIACHTTGKPHMNTLDKIIYIADYIEPGRCEAPNLTRIRQLAFENLDECLYRILTDSLDYLAKKDAVLDPMTKKTFEYYKRKLKK